MSRTKYTSVKYTSSLNGLLQRPIAAHCSCRSRLNPTKTHCCALLVLQPVESKQSNTVPRLERTQCCDQDPPSIRRASFRCTSIIQATAIRRDAAYLHSSHRTRPLNNDNPRYRFVRTQVSNHWSLRFSNFYALFYFVKHPYPKIIIYI